MRSRVDGADRVFLRIAGHRTARILVDGMGGKRMHVPERCTAAGTAARAATTSRRKLLSRRSGARLVSVVEKSGSARIVR